MSGSMTLLAAIFLLLYSSIGMFSTCFLLSKDISVMYEFSILEMSSSYMSFLVIVDPLSMSFSSVVCYISGAVMLFSTSYMSHDPFINRFTWLVILFVLSMNFLIFIISLPALLIGWDGLGIVSFALVVYYQNMKSLNAGMMTVLVNRVGDVMIILSIAIMVSSGYWSIILDHGLMWLGVCILIAGMTKSAQVPFSPWLPAAMAAPTPVSALVHSSTLVTAGVYLFIRFYPSLSSWSGFASILLFISSLTLFMAGLSANFETDLKKIIALSTLSQLGVMMMSLAIGSVVLTVFHLFTHALFKALLFLCAGTVISLSIDNQDLRYVGAMTPRLPLTMTCMNVANLALCGGPFLSGFYSKDLIMEFLLTSPTNALMTIVITVSMGLTAAYSLRLSAITLWGSMQGQPYTGEGWKEDNNTFIILSILLLVMPAIVAGSLLQVMFDPSMLSLPLHLKILTLSCVVFGIFSGLALQMIDKFYSNPKTYHMLYFASNMFMLTPMAHPITKMSMILGTNLIKSVDGGWLEQLGGQLAWKTSIMHSLMVQKVQVMMFSFSAMIVILFWVFDIWPYF